MMKYRVESKHTEFKADGLPLEPGDELELSPEEVEDLHYQQMLEDGRLVGIKPPPKTKTTTGKDDK
jgi:hypothetical protein